MDIESSFFDPLDVDIQEEGFGLAVLSCAQYQTHC